MANYGISDIKQTKKSNILTTEALNEKEKIDIDSFVSENGKGVNITSNSTYVGESDYNSIYTSEYADTVVAKNGNFDIWTTGNKGKKITTGNYNDTVHIANNGKNTIDLGNGKNDVIVTNMINTSNTVTTGIDNDSYTIRGGVNTVTDKGGDNDFTIETNTSTNTITTSTGNDTFIIKKGTNKITDKGGTNTYNISGDTQTTIKTSGNNRFDITLNYAGMATITANKGDNTLNITNHGVSDYTNEVTANLGDGVSIVNILHDDTPGQNNQVNITTGKSDDIFTIKAGKSNTINSGAGDDKFTITGGIQNVINSGKGNDTIELSDIAVGTQTIKAGKGEDKITIYNGNNTVYGEGDCDELHIFGGENIIYGGNDLMSISGGTNTIYAKGDDISIGGGNNEVFTVGGNNIFFISGGDIQHHINLTKGNNTLNVMGEATRVEATITAGKNILNTFNSATLTVDASKAKTAQYMSIEGSSFVGGQLGKGNDTIIIKSDAENSNILKTGGGADKISISAGKHKVYGEAGNDYFEIIGGTGHNVYGDEGNDKFLIQNSETKNGTIYGGAGNDTFNIEGGKEIHIYGNEGNDTFNIKQGADNVCYGGKGNDTFNIIGENGSGTVIWGEEGNNTYNVNGGTNSKIYGGSGKDTFNIISGTVADLGDAAGSAVYNFKGGEVTKTQGGDANDTFNITGGKLGVIKAGAGNDTFNIKGSEATLIHGEEGDDIYNLYKHDKALSINDKMGNNTYNFKKGYYSKLNILNMSTESDLAADKYVFDKSFKLTNGKNVKGGNLNTGKSNVSLFFHYDKNSSENGSAIFFVMDMADEISDKNFDTHSVLGITDTIETCTFGGKKYTVDLTEILADVAGWFGEHNTYSTTDDVLNSGSQADINSLMAVYVKDTAECFVKA